MHICKTSYILNGISDKGSRKRIVININFSFVTKLYSIAGKVSNWNNRKSIVKIYFFQVLRKSLKWCYPKV